MYLGQDLAALNKEFFTDLKEEYDLLLLEEKDKTVQLKYAHYCLSRSLLLISFYYCYGKNGTIAAGNLERQTEKLLLKVLWERCKYKNDIAEARKSTWWMSGSENHDLHTKVSNLLSSQIFINEDDYKERIYPDLGWGAHIFGGGGDFSRPSVYDMKGGRASLADGKKYKAEDHYKAWYKFMMEYFWKGRREGSG